MWPGGNQTNALVVLLFIVLLATEPTRALPGAVGVCYAGCAVVVVACYAAAGVTFGVTLAKGAPRAVLNCNAAFGSCEAACCRAFSH